MEPIRRNSKKRQAIYDALKSTVKHPSAEQLYELLKPEYPDLSLGTVYRNLGLLLDEGKIISVGNVDGEERFDAVTSSHAHFVCSKCGAVIDVMIDGLEMPDSAAVENALGGRVDDIRLSFTGICNNCFLSRTEASDNL